MTDPSVSISYNRYAYVNNNPMRYSDPTGFTPADIAPIETIEINGVRGNAFSAGVASTFLMGGGASSTDIVAQAVAIMVNEMATGSVATGMQTKKKSRASRRRGGNKAWGITYQAPQLTNSGGKFKNGKEQDAEKGNSTENWFWPGKHKYTNVSSAVCSAAAKGCTLSAIINILNKNGAHPNQDKPFIPGQPYTADADIPGPFGKDPINTYAIYNSSGNQVGLRNVTLPDHALHPGFVERTVININGSFHIRTYGGGTGPLGGPNNWLDGFVWGPVDNNVINKFK